MILNMPFYASSKFMIYTIAISPALVYPRLYKILVMSERLKYTLTV